MEGAPSAAARRGFENQIEQLQEVNSKNRDALADQFAEEYATAQSHYTSTAEQLSSRAKEDTEKAKEATKAGKENVKANYQKIAEELEEKYGQIMVDEMDKIRANPAFQEEKKKSSSSSSSASSKKMDSSYYNAIARYRERNSRRRR